MASSVENADVVAHDYSRDAQKIAKYVFEYRRLPGSLAPYEITNAFRFALGRVPQTIRDLYSLGEMASYADLGRAVKGYLAPKKEDLEPVYIGDRPQTLRELRLQRAERVAGAETEAGTHSPAPAIRKVDADAKAARDWRSAVEGK